MSSDGIENLAPFSQWQNITYNPPTVMFAATQHADGRRKDTVVNAEETGWFAWNMATWELREAVNVSARDVPVDVSEFDLVDVTRAYGDLSPVPMVAESPCHFECRYMSTHRLGVGAAAVDVVFGQVERIHIDDAVIMSDGRLDIRRIRPIARMGYFDYAVVSETFEMQVPGASTEELLGLEGTA